MQIQVAEPLAFDGPVPYAGVSELFDSRGIPQTPGSKRETRFAGRVEMFGESFSAIRGIASFLQATDSSVLYIPDCIRRAV